MKMFDRVNRVVLALAFVFAGFVLGAVFTKHSLAGLQPKPVGSVSILYLNGQLSMIKYGAAGGMQYSVYTDIKPTSCAGEISEHVVNCWVDPGSTLTIGTIPILLEDSNAFTSIDVYQRDLVP